MLPNADLEMIFPPFYNLRTRNNNTQKKTQDISFNKYGNMFI